MKNNKAYIKRDLTVGKDYADLSNLAEVAKLEGLSITKKILIDQISISAGNWSEQAELNITIPRAEFERYTSFEVAVLGTNVEQLGGVMLNTHDVYVSDTNIKTFESFRSPSSYATLIVRTAKEGDNVNFSFSFNGSGSLLSHAACKLVLVANIDYIDTIDRGD